MARRTRAGFYASRLSLDLRSSLPPGGRKCGTFSELRDSRADAARTRVAKGDAELGRKRPADELRSDASPLSPPSAQFTHNRLPHTPTGRYTYGMSSVPKASRPQRTVVALTLATVLAASLGVQSSWGLLRYAPSGSCCSASPTSCCTPSSTSSRGARSALCPPSCCSAAEILTTSTRTQNGERLTADPQVLRYFASQTGRPQDSSPRLCSCGSASRSVELPQPGATPSATDAGTVAPRPTAAHLWQRAEFARSFSAPCPPSRGPPPATHDVVV